MSQRFDGPAGARQVRLASRKTVIRRTTMLCLVAMLALTLIGPPTAHAQGLLQRVFGRKYGPEHRDIQVPPSTARDTWKPSSISSQAAATAAKDFIVDNLNQSRNSTIGLTLKCTNTDLGKAWSGYRAVQAADQFFNSGTPGSPIKGMKAIVAADAAFGGVLTHAGVGPQAAFAAGFVDTATKFTMNKLEEGTALARDGFARQNLDRFRQTGNLKDLARSAITAKPDVKYRHLESWNAKGALHINSVTGPFRPLNNATLTVPDLSHSWKTTVTKQPFQTNATGLIKRAADWTQWKLDPNNIQINSTFDRTFTGKDGTSRIQIEYRQTGFGYEPGKTHRYSSVRTEFHSNRTTIVQPPWVARNDAPTCRSFVPVQPIKAPRASTAIPTYARPYSIRPSYSSSSYSRPNFRLPSSSRPTVTRPSYSPPTFSRPSFSPPGFPR